MHRFVPLEAFEHEAQAVIAVDTDASRRLCNRAARRMLGCSCHTRGPCWASPSFLTLDGDPFCRPLCPVQQAAREGNPGAQHWVVPVHGPYAGRPVERISFFVPWNGSKRRAVLHFLRPALPAADTSESVQTELVKAAGRISTREEEVLRLLSEGRSTGVIAETLGIAKNTVRNHLSSIFHKLGVHGRVEALAAFNRRVMGASGPQRKAGRSEKVVRTDRKTGADSGA